MDNDSDQEYEHILESGWSKKPFRGGTNRPPQQSDGFKVKLNQYASKEAERPPVLPGLRRAASLNEGSLPPPPLPPPNFKKSPLSATRKAAPSPPARGIPPPLKPRSMTVDASLPPDVPPKLGPKTIQVSIQNPVPKSERKKISDMFVIENDELSLGMFVSKFRDDFPLHVRVSKGYYGVSDRTSVSEGDAFNIHFIKNTKVIIMHDGGEGVFKVALNSGIQFGVLYDPNNKRDEAVSGFTFEKVSDFQITKILPKVVRVGASWRGSGVDSTIEQNELLVIKGWRRKLNGRALKAYNPHTRAKKELPENCQGKFSTRPYDVRLYLSEIMDFVSDPLPCEAVFFVNSECSTDLPSYLISSVMKLKAVTTETTLVATAVFSEEDVENRPIEVPFDLDIEVQVMRPKKNKDTEDLYQTTRDLLENFKKVKTSSYAIESSNSESQSETQAAIYNTVREGMELAGVDIVKPSNIYNNLSQPRSPLKKSNSTPLSNKQTASISISESLYSECDDSEERFQDLEKRLNSMEEGMQQLQQKISSMTDVNDLAVKISREITSARADMKRLETRGSKTIEDASSAKSGVTDLKSVVEELRKSNDSMQNELKLLKNQLQTSSSSSQLGYMTLSHQSPVETTDSAYSSVDEVSSEMNRKFLSTLDFVQVLNLLECMGLNRHSDAFMEERVNGEILLECDDQILQEELRVTSKLQRVRILKLIHGKYSAEKILHGEDPYTYAKPK